METKIATSINQSQKLIELGLSADTADMYYYKENIFNNALTIFNGQLLVKGNSKLEDEYTIPAWSLSALINLLPVEIEGFNFKKDGEYWNLSILEYFSYGDVYFKVKYGRGEIEFEEHKLIDALIDMICWLKENRKI